MAKRNNTGAHKIKAANRIMFASLTEDHRKKLATQNSYRRTCGLLEIKSLS